MAFRGLAVAAFELLGAKNNISRSALEKLVYSCIIPEYTLADASSGFSFQEISKLTEHAFRVAAQNIDTTREPSDNFVRSHALSPCETCSRDENLEAVRWGFHVGNSLMTRYYRCEVCGSFLSIKNTREIYITKSVIAFEKYLNLVPDEVLVYPEFITKCLASIEIRRHSK